MNREKFSATALKKFDELRQVHKDEYWEPMLVGDQLDDFKAWLKNNDFSVRDAYILTMGATIWQQQNGRNHPDIMLEMRSIAAKYGFRDDPKGFFDAIGSIE
jgi:hypothetical protein